MKKFLSLLLVAVLAFGMVACGDSSTDGGNTNGGDDVTKVAILLPHIGDQSYLDIVANAKTLLDAEYGDAISVNIVQMGDDEADWEPANRQAAVEGYDIIVSGNWQYETAMLTVAAENPDIKYLNFDYSDYDANTSLPNVYAITYAANEIGYLTGVVAAVKSQTGIIGGIVGQDNAGMNQFMAGYIQGAAEVNPDIKVIITYVGSYVDPTTAKEQATEMINAGADVIWGCAGGSGNGVFEAVSEVALDADGNRTVWAIGVDDDQYATMSAKPELANTILTSGLKNADVAVCNAVKAIIEGTAPFGTAEMKHYSDGAVGLAENDYFKANMSDEEMAEVKLHTDKVFNGEVEVVDELTNSGIFKQLYAQYGLNK